MDNDQKSSGLAFNIGFDEKVARPPQCLSLFKNKQDDKEPLTLDKIEEKQQLANRRRQERMAEKLKRMQEREESTRKLVESAEKLLQQQSFERGKCEGLPDVVPKMSSREIQKTVRDVALRFKEMQRELLTVDLKVDVAMPHMPKKTACAANNKEAKAKLKRHSAAKNNDVKNIHCKSSSTCTSTVKVTQIASHKQKTGGMAFEIPIDEDKKTNNHKKRLPKTSLQARQCTTARELTAEELDEKQQRATERRQKRIEEKVRKTREATEALMKLRTNVNIYMQHEKAVEGEAEPEKVLSEQDAAYVAHEIAEGFSNIHSRYKNDLERAKNFSMFY